MKHTRRSLLRDAGALAASGAVLSMDSPTAAAATRSATPSLHGPYADLRTGAGRDEDDDDGEPAQQRPREEPLPSALHAAPQLSSASANELKKVVYVTMPSFK